MTGLDEKDQGEKQRKAFNSGINFDSPEFIKRYLSADPVTRKMIREKLKKKILKGGVPNGT